MRYTDYYAQKPWENTEDRFGIRDIVVNRAVKNKSLLRIFYNGKIAIHDPKWWRKTGEVIYRIYKRPDEPMRLFLNQVKWEQPKTEEQKARENYLISQGLL